MKILVKDTVRGQWLSQDGDWTESARDAWEFASCAEAVKYCLASETWQVEFVLRFRQLHETIDVPLEEASFSVAAPLRFRQRPLQTTTNRTRQCYTSSVGGK